MIPDRFAKYILGAVTLVIVISCIMFYFKISDHMQDVKAADQLPILKQNGWLPGWLPSDIPSFYEGHDLDLNQGIASFDANDITTESIHVNCTKIGPAQIVLPRGSFLTHRTWWNNKAILDNVLSGEWKLYQCISERGQRFYLTASSSRVYLWMAGVQPG